MGFAIHFSFITFRVEYDASKRALAWIKNKNMLSQEEYTGYEYALKLAAINYLLAILGSLAMLMYWALKLLVGRN